MVKYDEDWLRAWLRGGWREIKPSLPDLIWVEAARGGTPGAPDVFVPVRKFGAYVPLELKAWSHRERFVARPAQIRLHDRAAAAGLRSAFLGVYGAGNVVIKRSDRSVVNDVFSVMHLYGMLKSSMFWKGISK